MIDVLMSLLLKSKPMYLKEETTENLKVIGPIISETVGEIIMKLVAGEN